MKCEDFSGHIGRWEKEGELSREELDGLSRHAGSCPSCRIRYANILPLVERKGILQESSTGQIPVPDIASRVMARIGERQPVSLSGKRGRIFPAGWIAAAAGVVFVVLAGLTLLPRYLGSGGEYVTVRFIIDHPSAGSVSLAGDFSGWNPEMHLLEKKAPDGPWEIRVRLKKGGLYTYNFVIDGTEWIPDPNAPFQVKDGLGGESSLLQL